MLEAGRICRGGTPTSRDYCSICGDSTFSNPPEECDDGNTISGDGCTNDCTIEPGYTCSTTSPTVCQKCGDGKRAGTEICDDGNTFAYDGCSDKCILEKGFTCAGGGPSQADTCTEVAPMLTATLKVLETNDVVLTFSEPMVKIQVSGKEIKVEVYGPLRDYEYTWTAEFIGNDTVKIYTDFESVLSGRDTEKIVVSFVNLNAFKSLSSERIVNPDKELSGFLYATEANTATKAAGQTMMYVFLVSFVISIISSIGKNSVELMWGLMNTVQILFFISYIHIEYPKNLKAFFKYLEYANANNEFLSMLTYLIIPEKKFSQDEVNEQFGEKLFFLNSSDKIPVLLVTLVWFGCVFAFDRLALKDKGILFRWIYRVMAFFEYNYFIRFGLEIFLDLFLNSQINIFFVSKVKS